MKRSWSGSVDENGVSAESDKYFSYAERKILAGIQNNEILLKEILEKLNNLTNNGEPNDTDN